jgi:integrase
MLASYRGAITAMLNQRVRAADDMLTQADLEGICKKAYGEFLARMCDEQRRFPDTLEVQSVANRAYADYYHLQSELGEVTVLADRDISALRARGWPIERIEQQRYLMLQVADKEMIQSRCIESHLSEIGFKPSTALCGVVRRALYPYYREACLEAEQDLQRTLKSRAAFAGLQVSTSVDEVTETADVAPPPVTPSSAPSTTLPQSDARPLSELVQQAIYDRVTDGVWRDKTAKQMTATVTVFEALIGPVPLAAITQAQLAEFKRKIRFLPARYNTVDPASVAALKRSVEIAEAKATSQPKEARDGTPPLTNRTVNRHISAIAGLCKWAAGTGLPVPNLAFDKLQTPVSKQKRARNQRSATSENDIVKLFNLPIFTGCQPHSGGTGQRVLRARNLAGTTILHDAWYWILLLLYYTGARREELCKLGVDDIKIDSDVPYIWIDITDLGGVKNPQSVRPIPLHRELIRLGFLEFVSECRDKGYGELFPEIKPTNLTQNYGDVYSKNVWRHLAKWADVSDEATIHGIRHRFSTLLKNKNVFSESRADLLGHGGENITEERYSEGTSLANLQSAINELPSATDHLPAAVMNIPRPARRWPQPKKVRRHNPS